MDSNGKSATIAGGIIGGVCGFFGALVSELRDNNEEGKDSIRWDRVWQCTDSSAITGAASGLIADVSIATFGAGTAIFIAAGGGAVLSMMNSAYTQYTLTESVSAGKVISDGIIGGIANGLCTGTSTVVDPLVKGIKNGWKYAIDMINAELTPGFLDVCAFTVDDLLPTAITGFAGLFGGFGYDHTME